jgi:hypothetical protein
LEYLGINEGMVVMVVVMVIRILEKLYVRWP